MGVLIHDVNHYTAFVRPADTVLGSTSTVYRHINDMGMTNVAAPTKMEGSQRATLLVYVRDNSNSTEETPQIVDNNVAKEVVNETEKLHSQTSISDGGRHLGESVGNSERIWSEENTQEHRKT